MFTYLFRDNVNLSLSYKILPTPYVQFIMLQLLLFNKNDEVKVCFATIVLTEAGCTVIYIQYVQYTKNFGRKEIVLEYKA